jgi:RNA polymerase sigma-70 factor (ECF subfamily)
VRLLSTRSEPSNPPEDAAVLALVERAKQGSKEAYGVLVERFQPSLYGFLVARTTSPEDAEELCQEAFLRAWQRISLYDARWRFSTWLFTLARRIAATRYRRLRREESGHAALELVRSERAGPERIASGREECANLWALAAHVLSVEQRSALWLRYGEDLAPETIAAVLGKRTGTVRVILFRARERLLRALGEERSISSHAGAAPRPPDPSFPALAVEVES